jgi:hypothetical protein
VPICWLFLLEDEFVAICFVHFSFEKLLNEKYSAILIQGIRIELALSYVQKLFKIAQQFLLHAKV